MAQSTEPLGELINPLQFFLRMEEHMSEDAVPQGRTPGSAEVVQGSQLRVGMMGALDELTPKHREILFLRYYRDLSYAEIAAVLDIRLGTVMSRLSRARTNLSRVLGPEHPLAAEAS